MMRVHRPEDAIHKSWMYRLLIEIADHPQLSNNLCFKGGTCAAMLGLLDRFSVDLDFDYIGEAKEIPKMRSSLETIAFSLGLEIKDQSSKGFQYFFKYPAAENTRSTLKVDSQFPVPKANLYEPKVMSEINRTLKVQTEATIVANKLVAPLDRWKKNASIAGRDIYDIYMFLLDNRPINSGVIEERTLLKEREFFIELRDFIKRRITLTIINQDLNILLPLERFSQIRKILIPEVLSLVEMKCD